VVRHFATPCQDWGVAGGWPQTRYATLPSAGRDGDTAESRYVAWQSVGSGEPLVYLPQWFTNVETLWDVPPLRTFVEGLASFARVLLLDKRGTGLSDPAPASGGPFLEAFAEDVLTVLDDAGVMRTTLVAGDSAGMLAIWFAASYPERVRQLVLLDTFARLLPSGDDTRDPPPAFLARGESNIRRMWLQSDLSEMAPSLADDADAVGRLVRFLRTSASPGVAVATRRELVRLDVRPLLPAVQAPTLVLHHVGNPWADMNHARYLAEHIPDARIVGVPGEDHFFYLGDTSVALAEIEQFVVGAEMPRTERRALATVLFFDVVASTARLADEGDARWARTLERLVRGFNDAVRRHGGRPHRVAGDGGLALFVGPGQAISCARDLHSLAAEQGLRLRIGIHTGELELRPDDVVGLAVHIAARVQAAAAPGETLVTRTVVDLVAGSNLSFTDRGEHDLRGVPGRWQLLADDVSD
jgi:class 3 adenylate cyclase